LFTPEAAPASAIGTPRMVSVAIGAQIPPIPRPMMAIAGMNDGQSESVLDCATRIPAPRPYSARPVIRMYLPPTRSDIFPANGASTRAITDIGARISPALMAE
jgi:hypothetical protein